MGRLTGLLAARTRGALSVTLVLCAAPLWVSSGVHFYLYDIAYRYVGTLDWLFLVQASSAAAVGLALVIVHRGAVALAALGLMAGTILGFVLVLTVGLFGFTLTFISGWAIVTLVAESVAVLVLAAVVARLFVAGTPVTVVTAN